MCSFSVVVIGRGASATRKVDGPAIGPSAQLRSAPARAARTGAGRRPTPSWARRPAGGAAMRHRASPQEPGGNGVRRLRRAGLGEREAVESPWRFTRGATCAWSRPVPSRGACAGREPRRRRRCSARDGGRDSASSSSRPGLHRSDGSRPHARADRVYDVREARPRAGRARGRRARSGRAWRCAPRGWVGCRGPTGAVRRAGRASSSRRNGCRAGHA